MVPGPRCPPGSCHDLTSVPSAPRVPGRPAARRPAGPARHPAAAPQRHRPDDRGVCGGLAEHVGIDALLWRIGFVALTVAGGSGVLVYLALWVLMPPAPRAPHESVSAAERLAERAHDAVADAAGTRRQG